MVDKIFINLQPRVVVNMLGICADNCKSEQLAKGFSMERRKEK